jgi:hypothetical protein
MAKGESLETFLRQHPVKRLDSLRHLCCKMDLSEEGTIATLQSRLLQAADGKPDIEEKIRQAANEFKSGPSNLSAPPQPLDIPGEISSSLPIDTDQTKWKGILSPTKPTTEIKDGTEAPLNTPTSDFSLMLTDDDDSDLDTSLDSGRTGETLTDHETFETGHDESNNKNLTDELPHHNQSPDLFHLTQHPSCETSLHKTSSQNGDKSSAPPEKPLAPPNEPSTTTPVEPAMETENPVTEEAQPPTHPNESSTTTPAEPAMETENPVTEEAQPLPNREHQHCLTAEMVHCPQGLALKSRLNHVLKQTKQRNRQEIENLKNETRKLRTDLEAQKTMNKDLRKNKRSQKVKDMLSSQDKTITELKSLNLQMVNSVTTLINHNEYAIDQIRRETTEKIQMINHEKESLSRTVIEATNQLKIAQEKIENQTICSCNDNQAQIAEICRTQEKSFTSTEIWQGETKILMENLTSKIHDVESELKMMDKNLPPRSPLPAEPQVHNLNHSEAPSLLNPSYPSRESVIVLHDSNGKNIRGAELFRAKNVIMEQRNTAKQALNQVPQIPNPMQVSDVVIMTGLNDSKSINEKIETTVQTELDLITKYCKVFKNARFHLTCVPPSTTKQELLNTQLEQLAKRLQISFISSKPFYDRESAVVRHGILHQNDKYHYDDLGTRTLAKQIKLSLHSRAVTTIHTQHIHTQHQQENAPNNRNTIQHQHIPPLMERQPTTEINRTSQSASNSITSLPHQKQDIEQLLTQISGLLSKVQSNFS